LQLRLPLGQADVASRPRPGGMHFCLWKEQGRARMKIPIQKGRRCHPNLPGGVKDALEGAGCTTLDIEAERLFISVSSSGTAEAMCSGDGMWGVLFFNGADGERLSRKARVAGQCCNHSSRRGRTKCPWEWGDVRGSGRRCSFSSPPASSGLPFAPVSR
jgi:hypothetical protein